MVHITVADIIAAGGLEAYQRSQNQAHVPTYTQGPGYAHVRAKFTWGTSIINQAAATLSVNESPQSGATFPMLGSAFQSRDHIVGQFWMMSDGYRYPDDCAPESNCMQTVEAGWMILGGGVPTFMVFATNTGYYAELQGEACPAQGCPTWVAAPNAPIARNMTLPWNVPGTTPPDAHELQLRVQNATPAWWIYVGQSAVGYYSPFWGAFQTAAAKFSVGGEVSDFTGWYQSNGAGNWGLPMGSGAAASAGLGQAAYVHDMWACSASYGFSSAFQIDSVSTEVAAYTYANGDTGTSGKSGWSNYFFYGGAPQVFWTNSGYGWDLWSPTSPKDWDVGSPKAECGITYSSYLHQTLAQPLIGISKSTTGTTQPAHAILCGVPSLTITANQSCHTLQFNPSDNRAYSDNGWDWDSGNPKGECAQNEFVSGVAQSYPSANLNTILCCPSDVTHRWCNVQTFYSGNSAAYYPNSPDWDPWYFKGQCTGFQYAAGVSSIGDASKGVVGAPHAILCCTP